MRVMEAIATRVRGCVKGRTLMVVNSSRKEKRDERGLNHKEIESLGYLRPVGGYGAGFGIAGAARLTMVLC